MINKTSLLVAALLLAPVITVLAGFYIATFFPVYTFRTIEKSPAEAGVISLQTDPDTAASIKTVEINKTITQMNKNGTVRVNNLG